MPKLWVELFGTTDLDEDEDRHLDNHAVFIMRVLHQQYSEVLRMSTSERRNFYKVTLSITDTQNDS